MGKAGILLIVLTGSLMATEAHEIVLDAEGNQFWHQDQPGIGGVREEDDQFGSAVAWGDFNDDGRDDLAIGAPGEAIGDEVGAGMVHVLYSDTAGRLSANGSQVWHQDRPGIEGRAEAGDRYGAALAVGDFDGDGRDDLAIGVPGEAVGPLLSAGAISILFASSSGLSSSGDRLLHESTIGASGSAEAGGRFGEAMAAGDFDGDGYTDLAIGVPGGTVSETADAGRLWLLTGVPRGRSPVVVTYDQSSSGIAGGPEGGDGFGHSLATGDFNGDAIADLAIGVPGEAIGRTSEAGAVHVLYGRAGRGLEPGDQIWHQDQPGVSGRSELGDVFGFSLAAADLDNDGATDLVVGVPGEAIGDVENAGAVNVLYGARGTGLTSRRDEIWHRGGGGIPGDAVPHGHLGYAVSAANLGLHPAADLAIGAARDMVPPDKTNRGSAYVIYGSSAGLHQPSIQHWHLDAREIDGNSWPGDRYGAALAARDGGIGRGALAVGLPGRRQAGRSAGAVSVLYTAGLDLTRPYPPLDIDVPGWPEGGPDS